MDKEEVKNKILNLSRNVKRFAEDRQLSDQAIHQKQAERRESLFQSREHPKDYRQYKDAVLASEHLSRTERRDKITQHRDKLGATVRRTVQAIPGSLMKSKGKIKKNYNIPVGYRPPRLI